MHAVPSKLDTLRVNNQVVPGKKVHTVYFLSVKTENPVLSLSLIIEKKKIVDTLYLWVYYFFPGALVKGKWHSYTLDYGWAHTSRHSCTSGWVVC